MAASHFSSLGLLAPLTPSPSLPGSIRAQVSIGTELHVRYARYAHTSPPRPVFVGISPPRPDTRIADEAQLTHGQGEADALPAGETRKSSSISSSRRKTRKDDTLLPCLRRGFACLRLAELLGADRAGFSAILAGDARAGILGRTRGLRH
ncbi:hypothetical protein E2C01_010774 [Portunus trituberculatus]|uniref:Uncharacterized protein n=1 Tax=Portunus trituberculatus TaxID=210409 RepID=A0A5B7D9B5_PORTR|nr:hypothetical protein [Portunus trituberculatus]